MLWCARARARISLADNPLDSTGTWDGVFVYPQDALPKTPFVAEIVETAGRISGSTLEPDLYSHSPLKADLVGHRSERAVDFTKSYIAPGQGYKAPVDYVGQLSEDGQMITGSWMMQEWSGGFEMTRQAGAGAKVEAKESAEVD